MSLSLNQLAFVFGIVISPLLSLELICPRLQNFGCFACVRIRLCDLSFGSASPAGGVEYPMQDILQISIDKIPLRAPWTQLLNASSFTVCFNVCVGIRF